MGIVVNIVDRGAKNDGSSDAAALFNAAIAEVSQGSGPGERGRVIVPPGRYRIDDTIILKSNVDLAGTNRAANEIFLNQENKNAVVIETGSQNVSIQSLTIRDVINTQQDKVKHEYYGVLVHAGAKNVTIRDCWIVNVDDAAIRINSLDYPGQKTEDVLVSENLLMDAAQSSIEVTNAWNVTVDRNFLKNRTKKHGHGIRAIGCKNSTFSRNTICNVSNGFSLQVSNTEVPADLDIHDNLINGCVNGFDIRTGATRVNIFRNWIEDSEERGLLFSWVADNEETHKPESTKISQIRVFENTISGVWEGVRAQGDCVIDGLEIIGNVFRGFCNFATNEKVAKPYGIHFNFTSTPGKQITGLQIDSNTFSEFQNTDCLAMGIFEHKPNTYPNAEVRNNKTLLPRPKNSHINHTTTNEDLNHYYEKNIAMDVNWGQ